MTITLLEGSPSQRGDHIAPQLLFVRNVFGICDLKHEPRRKGDELAIARHGMHLRLIVLHAIDDKTSCVLGDPEMLRERVAPVRVRLGNFRTRVLLVERRFRRGAIAEIADDPLPGSKIETVFEYRDPAVL